jgi:hypothetical protein
MGLTEEIKNINTKLEEITTPKGKKKKFKLPSGAKVGKGQAKKNYVTILKANENGHGQWIKEQIKEQTVIIDGIPRLATSEYIINIGKNPIMVIPSWSIQPINFRKIHEASLADGSNTAGYQLILNSMKLNLVGGKKKMKAWIAWVIGTVIFGIIGYALFTGGI